jgi:hypothetical protein
MEEGCGHLVAEEAVHLGVELDVDTQKVTSSPPPMRPPSLYCRLGTGHHCLAEVEGRVLLRVWPYLDLYPCRSVARD